MDNDRQRFEEATDQLTSRVLIGLLFTDIVDSTRLAAELGDRSWLRLVEQHHARVRELLVRFDGREVDCAGDGFFATFGTATSAVRCGTAIRASVETLGLQVREGLHTAECELTEGRVRGIAVHTAARLVRLARAGEILVTETVRDVVAGSGIRFEERGSRVLRGVPGLWRLYAVTDGEQTALHPVVMARRQSGRSGDVRWRGGLRVAARSLTYSR